MAELIAYRQGRADGGIRSGIELNGEPIFGHFEEGTGERDPTLLWYVDLRCRGSGVPDDPRAARPWLIDHEDTIRSGFRACAAELEAGRDIELHPLLWSRFENPSPEVEMTIACAANRRLWSLSLPTLLEDVAQHWKSRLERLEAAEWVS